MSNIIHTEDPDAPRDLLGADEITSRFPAQWQVVNVCLVGDVVTRGFSWMACTMHAQELDKAHCELDEQLLVFKMDPDRSWCTPCYSRYLRPASTTSCPQASYKGEIR